TSTTKTSKIIDLVSSNKSETNSLVSSDYDTQEDDYFQNDDDDNGVNLVIKHLLATSAATKKKIANAIKFVSKVIHEEKLSETEKARYIATLYFLQLLFNGKRKIKASKAVAKVIRGGPWFAKCVRKWANICMKGELIQHFYSKFPSKSLLNNELVSLKLAAYLYSQKFKVNPTIVKNYVEQQIIPQLDVYIDGYERPDIVVYHQVFLQKVSEFEQFMFKWYDEDYKIRTYLLLVNEEKKHIWVTHDEFTFHVNNGPRAMWGPKGEQLLRKKGMGLGIHVSDFLMKTIGPLRDDLEEAREIIILESCYDGLFAFDNATAHTAFAKDTLLSSKINLFPGGSVLKMQDTVWNRNCQLMVIEEDYIIYDNKTKLDINLRDQPKGLKWQEGMVLECASCKKEPNPNITNCCAYRLMANQPDFLAQCGQVQQKIESHSYK
ncbi:15263_t:CDS:2, partial [Gigaspora margarita]